MSVLSAIWSAARAILGCFRRQLDDQIDARIEEHYSAHPLPPSPPSPIVIHIHNRAQCHDVMQDRDRFSLSLHRI